MSSLRLAFRAREGWKGSRGLEENPLPLSCVSSREGVGGLEEKPPSSLRLALRAREGWAAGYRTERPLHLEFGAREGVGAG